MDSRIETDNVEIYAFLKILTIASFHVKDELCFFHKSFPTKASEIPLLYAPTVIPTI